MQLYNLQAEKAIIGSCLIDRTNIDKALEYLTSDDFYSTNHKIIFYSMTKLIEKGIIPDLITVSDFLKNKNKLETIGGYTYLTALINSVPINQNVEAYSKIIKEKSKQRKIYEILETLKEGKITIEESLNKISALPIEVNEENLKLIFKNAIIMSTKGTAHQFKLSGLNRYLGGVDKGELITIGGFTSQGKTSLALSLSVDFADSGKNVLYLTSEMSVYETARRILANLLPKNIMDLRKGYIQENEMKALNDIAEMAGDNWKLNIKKVFNMEDINKYIRRYNPEIVFVDYLQNLDRKGARSDYERVTGNIKDLQGITLRNEITTFVLSQLSRNKEQVREPKLSDLRDSGRIEEVSNIVLFVYWEDRLKEKVEIRKGGEPPETLKIKIGKNRDGTVGGIDFAFWPEYCRVKEFEYKQYEQKIYVD